MVEGEQEESGGRQQSVGKKDPTHTHRSLEVPLTRAGPARGIPGHGHIQPSGNPGLLTPLELEDHPRSGGRESCRGRRASEGPAPAHDSQLPDRRTVRGQGS